MNNLSHLFFHIDLKESFTLSTVSRDVFICVRCFQDKYFVKWKLKAQNAC